MEGDKIVNLHQHQLNSKYDFENLNKTRYVNLCKIMDNSTESYDEIVSKVNTLYSAGYSAIDLNEWIQQTETDDGKKSAIELCFEKVKPEYRCEKLLMLYLINQYYELKNVSNNVNWMNRVGFI
jgi:hypothetical protein